MTSDLTSALEIC